MSSDDSVTQWIVQLQAEDPRARNESAQEIWRRYSARLLALARQQLGEQVRRREDEQDVVQSMFKSFCLRQSRGEFTLDDRDDLWTVLATITLRKAWNVRAHQTRQRRDCRREITQSPDPRDRDTLDRLAGGEVTPADAAVFREEIRLRLELLPEPLRQIALWKLAGYTNDEIAGPDMMDCAERTVRRKLARIRSLWEQDEAEA